MDQMMERLEQLEKKVDRIQDRIEIENLMSKYQYYYMARMNQEILSELWAQNVPDITMEDRFYGIYEGFHGAFPDAGLIMYYDTVMNVGSPKDSPGRMSVFTTTTPVIEIAEDRKTAKGVWISIGNETDAGDFGYEGAGSDPAVLSGATLNSVSPDGKRYMADWVWQKYGVDFIREDGEWKIWHFHIYDIFRCPYNEDWVSYAKRRIEIDTVVSGEREFSHYGKPPGEGTSYHWQYSPDTLPELQPKPPVPYKTFDDTFRY